MKDKKYKVYVADYNPDMRTLLCSFSSQDTKRDAKDYQSYNYDLTIYKDKTRVDIILEIAMQARTICQEIEDREQYAISEEEDEILEKLEGKEFEFTHQELFPTLYMSGKELLLDGQPSANPASDHPEVDPIPESKVPSEKSEEV